MNGRARGMRFENSGAACLCVDPLPPEAPGIEVPVALKGMVAQCQIELGAFSSKHRAVAISEVFAKKGAINTALARRITPTRTLVGDVTSPIALDRA